MALFRSLRGVPVPNSRYLECGVQIQKLIQQKKGYQIPICLAALKREYSYNSQARQVFNVR